MALPAALLRGDCMSSAATDGPMVTPLIIKSPARNVGMLPATSTLTDRSRGVVVRFSAVPDGSRNVYDKSSDKTELFNPAVFAKVTTPLAAVNVPVNRIVLLSWVMNDAVTLVLLELTLILSAPLCKNLPLLANTSVALVMALRATTGVVADMLEEPKVIAVSGTSPSVLL